ncbi:hypothetical protein L1787_04360 [Acuticoccus sp. M5D2P5]|uniref:hypothetical protein n=1 Tax=Acuticoccus kalidii TaxID=2910977 RepID=UPI001F463184|nr:hypothetical protein [Acuticoccus kalidii]MCF3932649.1 hypothetical protein [Acuticoccus kalidii]
MNYYEAILAGDHARHNGMTDVGAPAIVTYHFTSGDDLWDGLAAADEALQTAMRLATRAVERVAGVLLVEVGEAADAMITLSYNTFGTGESWAGIPDVTANRARTVSEIAMTDTYESFDRGSYGFQVLLHEVGHALGLKHPFDGEPTLSDRFDNTNRTLMSYNDVGHDKAQYRSLDQQALKYLYGPPKALAGVEVTFDDAALTLHVTGTSGDDTLIGGNDFNRIVGGRGHDELFGRDLGDVLIGGSGSDRLSGLRGNDTIVGGPGHDTLIGGHGRDELNGNGGHDILHGDGGHDALFGGGGHDTLDGGRGNDTLDGGAGSDLLTGGRGADTFVVTHLRGNDTITDFVQGQDVLDMSALGLPLSAILARFHVDGDDMVFETDNGTVRLLEAAALTFTEADFAF